MERKFLFGLVVVLCVAFGQCDNMPCPPSPAPQHAGCEVTISFKNSCSDVQNEITNRINGQYTAWHDPHNNGTYAWISNSSAVEWEMSRLTGNGQYTDLMIFTFTVDVGGCSVTACSQSQVFSINDFGTNYCNVHDLYCSDSQCHPLSLLTYTEKIGTCTESGIDNCYLD